MAGTGEFYDRVRADHRCACSNCDPTVRLDGPRLGANHVAVRFWDELPEVREAQKKAMIVLDGEPVDRALEAILGEQGAVWFLTPMPSETIEIRGKDVATYGTHHCMTCYDAAAARGAVSEHDFRIVRLRNGTTIEENFEVCTSKREGDVKLQVRARTES